MDHKLPDDTLERFRKLTDQIDCWKSLSLTGSGEPLLSPALPELLALIGPHPVATTLDTHGNLLDSKRAEMLVRNGLEAISISVDAACRETYERIRTPAKWDKLLAGIAVQPDGRILVAGTSGSSSGYRFALARYDAVGVLDPSFGNGGLVLTAGSSQDEALAIARQPDGRIVLAGRTYGDTGYDIALMRCWP